MLNWFQNPSGLGCGVRGSRRSGEAALRWERVGREPRWTLKRVQGDELERREFVAKRKWGQHRCQPHVHLHCFRMILGDRLSRFCFGWLCIVLADFAGPALACPVARESRLSSPDYVTGVGPVRRSGWILRSAPSTWRFRDHSDALSFPAFRSTSPKLRFPSAVYDRGQSDRLTANLSLHLRFARFRPRSS